MACHTAGTGAVDPEPVTEDRLLDGRVRLLQPKQGYRAAIDPVLLAAAVPVRPGEAVLELGCGVGAASLCLAARVPDCTVTGIEQQPFALELARRNAACNGMAERFLPLAGDVAGLPTGLRSRGFDRVMMNPPYYESSAHTPSPHPGKAVSHGEGETDLAVWVQAALRQLAARGTLTLIHRADRLDRILNLLQGRFGAVVVFPLWPRSGEPAGRVLVQARRNTRTPLRLAPGLVLHGPDVGYTAAAQAILREGAPLVL